MLTEEIRSIGERHFAAKTSFRDDMATYWGRWGATSEVGRLRSVLLRRPGAEIEGVVDPDEPRWRDVMHPGLARAQHDRMAEIYREHGVEVYYVQEMAEDRPNAVYCRDLMAMTPEGAIITRPAMAARRGEERYVAATVASLGVPIVKTINGMGTFEGADLLMIDRHSAFLGWGNRTNEEGARQVIEELHHQGVHDVTIVQVPYGVAHLDCMFGLASTDVALVFPWMTPFIVVEKLLEKGYKVLEIQDPREARFGYSVNFVALEPGFVLLPAGNPQTVQVLEEGGVRCIEVEMTEILKGMGAVHCCTGFLHRDDI
jgi:N-dimethylarginine dimethylaminohydrolase